MAAIAQTTDPALIRERHEAIADFKNQIDALDAEVARLEPLARFSLPTGD